MPRTPDMFDGWFDNQKTQHRERWDNGARGPHAHRRTICPHAHWRELRAPWGTYPDLPSNAGVPAHG